MTDQRFKVIMPNGKNITLFYNKESDRNEIINKYVLKYWEDYLLTHWLWQHKFDPFRMNFEDKNKSMLDRLGTFLLLGNLKNGMVMTDNQIKKVHKKEMPASSTGSNIQDMIYGMDNGEDYTVQSNNNNIHDLEIVLGNIDEDKDIL
jgi:hypothetical protein